MTVTKVHIVERLFAENLFTKTALPRIVENLFELIKQSLQLATSKNRRIFSRRSPLDGG